MALPNVRRVVTAYNSEGKSVFWHDAEVEKPLWGTDAFPSTNQLVGGTDGTATLPQSIINPGGSTFRIVDTGPGASSPIHRTESVDYVIVLSGEIVLELEDGVETTLKAGDIVVQQGTLHAWHNRTDTTTRFAVVCLAAKPVEISNVTLQGPTFP